MTEIFLFIGLGYMVLGPQRMRTVLQHIARAKQQFEKARADLTSQISTDIEAGKDHPLP